MKQVNVLMEEALLSHLESLSTLVSVMCLKKVTVSDIVRKSVVEYSKYGQVTIESELKDQNVQINIKPTTEKGYKDLVNDELMQKICLEEW